jgi:hypothetical protein
MLFLEAAYQVAFEVAHAVAYAERPLTNPHVRLFLYADKLSNATKAPVAPQFLDIHLSD